MAVRVDDPDKLAGGHGTSQQGYDAWKREKIERGLAQSRDRSLMIPIEQLWRDLSLER